MRAESKRAALAWLLSYQSIKAPQSSCIVLNLQQRASWSASRANGCATLRPKPAPTCRQRSGGRNDVMRSISPSASSACLAHFQHRADEQISRGTHDFSPELALYFCRSSDGAGCGCVQSIASCPGLMDLRPAARALIPAHDDQAPVHRPQWRRHSATWAGCPA